MTEKSGFLTQKDANEFYCLMADRGSAMTETGLARGTAVGKEIKGSPLRVMAGSEDKPH